MKITKLQPRNRIRKMIREAVGETSTDGLHLTRKQNAALHKIEKQRQILGISGEDPAMLDLGAGATVEIWADESQFWYLNGQLHRTDGPAEIWPGGAQFWWLNGQRHRTDGPAAIWADGTQRWYLNGQLHRVDGPAVINADGSQFWFLNGDEVTQKEHALRTTSERT